MNSTNTCLLMAMWLFQPSMGRILLHHLMPLPMHIQPEPRRHLFGPIKVLQIPPHLPSLVSKGLTSRRSSWVPVITVTNLMDPLLIPKTTTIVPSLVPPPCPLPHYPVLFPALSVTTQTSQAPTTITPTLVTHPVCTSTPTSIHLGALMPPLSSTAYPFLHPTVPTPTGISQSTQPWRGLKELFISQKWGLLCHRYVWLSWSLPRHVHYRQNVQVGGAVPVVI